MNTTESIESEGNKLLVEWPSDASISTTRNDDLKETSFTPPPKAIKKQVKFAPRSLMHLYLKTVDNKDLCHSRRERHTFQLDAITMASNIRGAIRGQVDVPMETDVVYLHLKSNNGIHGIEAEEMIGIEHLIEYRHGNDHYRRRIIRTVVREWRRLCSDCETREEEKCNLQVAALARKLSRDSALKARRRAKYVQWMNELPADIELSKK